MSAHSKQIFRDSDEDKGFRAEPDDPLPVNTVFHRVMGSLLGTTFILGGLDMVFRLFHVFSSPALKPSRYDLSIGIFFAALGIGLLIYAIQSARAAKKNLVPIGITSAVVLLIFCIPMFL
jgi:hypothetical protein